MLLQAGQPLCRGVEVDNELSPRIEEEECIVRLAEQAACYLELAFFGVHDQSGPQPGNLHAAATRRGTYRNCMSLVNRHAPELVLGFLEQLNLRDVAVLLAGSLAFGAYGTALLLPELESPGLNFRIVYLIRTRMIQQMEQGREGRVS